MFYCHFSQRGEITLVVEGEYGTNSLCKLIWTIEKPTTNYLDHDKAFWISVLGLWYQPPSIINTIITTTIWFVFPLFSLSLCSATLFDEMHVPGLICISSSCWCLSRGFCAAAAVKGGLLRLHSSRFLLSIQWIYLSGSVSRPAHWEQ